MKQRRMSKLWKKKKKDETTSGQDKIKEVITDNNNRVVSITLVDGNKFSFKDFIQLFKERLQTMIAGEVISWNDE